MDHCDITMGISGLSRQVMSVHVRLLGLRNKAVSSLQALLISSKYNVRRLKDVLSITETQAFLYHSQP